MNQHLSLTRILQLSSVSLPVGGYAFSQGMEMAIERGWIRKQDDVEEWIRLQLKDSMAGIDLPILRESMRASEADQVERLVFLNDLALASRETKELRLTDTAMGEALLRLLRSLDFEIPVFKGSESFKALKDSDPLNTTEYSFVVLFGFACSRWDIPYEMAANGFLWSWLENQVAAATKLVPLGQTQAQLLLTKLQTAINETIALSEGVSEDNIGGGLPGMAIASALHERQYSRLFRS